MDSKLAAPVLSVDLGTQRFAYTTWKEDNTDSYADKFDFNACSQHIYWRSVDTDGTLGKNHPRSPVEMIWVTLVL